MAQKHSTEYIEKPMTRDGRIQSPSRRYRRLRHPTFPSAEWADKNPLLQRGEIGAESDTHRIKVGDGLTYWNDLPYASDVVATWGAINGDITDQADLTQYVAGAIAGEATLRENADTALQGQITTNKNTMDGHIADTNNPHSVTKAQVGLGNVDNTSDIDKPISTATQTALDSKADKTNLINGTPLSTTSAYFFGTSDTPAATVQKEVSIPTITELNVGQVIIVQPSITSTVANSTLKLNDFTAYPMRYNGSAISTSTDSYVWSAAYPTIWVFDGTYWVFAAHGIDNNTTYTVNYSIDAGKYTAGVGTYAVTRYSILAQKPDMTWEKITATNASYTTATTKSVNTSGFLLNQLRYYATTTNVATGVKIASNVVYEKAASVDMRYSTNCGATTPWAEGDYIYLVGTIGADGLFYLDTTTWWTNTLPTTNDGKLYIRLGLALAAAGATMSFFDDRPIFYHNGVKLCEYKVADNKQDTIADLATIRSNASAGKTASDTIATYGDIVTHNTSEFATSAQGALADTAIQPGDNVSELVNDAGYLTQHQTLADLGITATATEINVLDGITASTTELNYVDGVTSSIQTQIDNKQGKSSSAYNMGNGSGGWTAMTTAQQNALNSGATTTNIGQIATNTNNIASEITNRQNADNGLQTQIDALVSKSDVVDVVGTYAELQAYDTSSLGNNDVVKVLDDSTHNDAQSYYRWVITGGVGSWVYIGSEAETYTKAETDALLNAKQNTLTAGSNIQISGNTISATDTTYTGSDGITLTGTNFTNSGVRAVTSGTTNGTISVDTGGTTANVSVTGLGSAAYTASTAYATAAQGGKADTAVQPGDLATVATTGSYNDLLNKPTIPAAQVNSDWNANSGVAQILNKPTLGTAASANTTDFATAAQGALATTAVQPGDLATVATSGSYNDLLNKPTLGTMAAENASDYTKTANLATVATSGQYSDLSGTPSLATVATSGSYNDLSNKPTIPTVNNPTITFTQGGVTKGSFTLNQATGDTIALDAGGGGGGVVIDNSTITKNSDNEIQAVATINVNTAAGATNPVYDWVGTLAEYTAQDIENQHPDWLCYITDDFTAGAYDAYSKSQTDTLLANKVNTGHEVIEFQAPTAGNNYTWYRKYADGWIEQGGVWPHPNPGTYYNNVTITLPVVMADANYSVILSNTGTNTTAYAKTVSGKTTTEFVCTSGGDVSKYNGFDWAVRGMAA